MVCHSDRQYLHHSLLPVIIDFLSQSDENFYHHLHQKNLDVPFWQIYQYLKLCSLPVLYCTTTVVLHYLAPQRQCCNLCCVDEILSQFACPSNVKVVLILGKILRTRLSLFCFRLFLPVPSHLQNSVAGKDDYIIFFFLSVLLDLQICVAGCRHPFLFNWRTGKTKTPILLYIMQHPRQFLIFGVNFNGFSVSWMQHLHVELSINFRNSNFKNYRHCQF